MTSLIKYDAARTALAECKAVDEVKDWLDKSAAVQAYGRMAKDKTLEIDAAEIRIRAERRLGEVLAEQKANGGFNRGSAGLGINHHTPEDVRSSVTTAPKLSDMGISKDLSSRSQKLAAVPADEFESEVSEWRDRVGQENARVTARLEKAGENALKNQNPVVVEEEEYDPYQDEIKELSNTVIDLQEENEKLRSALAINQIPEGLEIEDADTIIDTLRARVKQLEIEVKAITQSRDTYLRENSQLKEQIRRQAAQLKKLGVKASA